MGLYPEPPRPRMCPESRCHPLIQWPGYTKEQFDAGTRDWAPGESWVCWGVLAEPVVFTYDGVEHPNDCRSCTFTPSKGLIAFQENRDDWWMLARRYEAALEQLDAYRAARALDELSSTSEELGLYDEIVGVEGLTEEDYEEAIAELADWAERGAISPAAARAVVDAAIRGRFLVPTEETR